MEGNRWEISWREKSPHTMVDGGKSPRSMVDGGKEQTLTNIRWRLPRARQIAVCNCNDTQPIPYSPSASTFSPCAAWGTGDGSGVPLVLAHFPLCCLGHKG
jgi:hypothetical protein